MSAPISQSEPQSSGSLKDKLTQQLTTIYQDVEHLCT